MIQMAKNKFLQVIREWNKYMSHPLKTKQMPLSVYTRQAITEAFKNIEKES